jgi:hypothetical protein
MPLNLTPNQAQQLHSLGIDISNPNSNISESNKNTLDLSPNIGENQNPPIISTKPVEVLTKSKTPIIPILSLSGLTIISFGGLMLLKNKAASTPISPSSPQNQAFPSPTQVPKSIQHYLLTSQQYFTQALAAQTASSSPADLLNQSLLAATDAIKAFPDDYRGYEQRGRIYQSLIASQPQLLSSAIADFTVALRLNPSSPDLTRTLAALYARQGDAQTTLNYLSETITLEPTKAQNFYDLARLQQQVGLLSEAVSTYDRLLTIVSDPSQKQAVVSEKTALEKLVAQNVHPSTASAQAGPTSTIPIPSITTDTPLLQAGLPAGASAAAGLIIAAPESNSNITVSNLSTSNSLSGNATLPAQTTQIIISNTNLTPASQVYVTIISGGKNQSLQVLSKSKTSFTVGLDSPISEDIQFKWWIIN